MEKDRSEYQAFTKPAEVHKAVNTLRGLVAGINSDASVGEKELNELINWCELQAPLRDRHPFSELLPIVEAACADGVVTADEAKDILWLCNNFADNSSYYDVVTSSIQFLSGMIHGIMADGELSDSEITTLYAWIKANDFLTGTYPFDEINSLLSVILEDKKITDDERKQLMAFFSNIIDFSASANLSEEDFVQLREKYSVSGICAVCPEIVFKGKTFCFTGESYRAKRSKMAEAVRTLGGIAKSSVNRKTDYLVVGNAGNPCWAYACYGRKIEEAVQLRKEGAPVVIVNETDFWDALDDANAGIEE
ncbi:MAG: NAD-dependent DNA ligase [Oscillibacter sp.]|uniref:BRCT domain-containing protein n=1 Tax=Oscillibacter sp. TaxID=1945593 RepID=UPI001325A9C8|nr:BRCT domain-containing protein [Oscillibacter sp.]MUU10883.1 NAD-dependent DNA ligase [Oscillibacter sp.]